MVARQVHGSPSASRDEPPLRDVSASTGALWKCRGYGRPAHVVLHLKVGEAGVHSPLEISRAIAAAQACAGGREIPTLPQRSLSMTDTERRSSEGCVMM